MYVTLINLGPPVGPLPTPIKGPGFNNHKYKEAYNNLTESASMSVKFIRIQDAS